MYNIHYLFYYNLFIHICQFQKEFLVVARARVGGIKVNIQNVSGSHCPKKSVGSKSFSTFTNRKAPLGIFVIDEFRRGHECEARLDDGVRREDEGRRSDLIFGVLVPIGETRGDALRATHRWSVKAAPTCSRARWLGED